MIRQRQYLRKKLGEYVGEDRFEFCGEDKTRPDG